ncbi:hypothetical protein CKW39_00430 [Kocuria sp. WRN011]|nr:hypothetical protein CKW39_00430 [Kocuria sp. WRN011]
MTDVRQTRSMSFGRRVHAPPELAEPASNPGDVVLRVELLGIEPVIWRRIRVGQDARLPDLHTIVNAAMGWLDCHLHSFRVEDNAPFLTNIDLIEGSDAGIHEGSVRVSQVLCSVGDELMYDYDFGDGWEHRITLEEILPSIESTVPHVLDGARACPPEDCGGIPGYGELLRARQATSPDEHQRMLLDWCPPGWDPERFDVDRHNRVVNALMNPQPLDDVRPELIELIDSSATRKELLVTLQMTEFSQHPPTEQEMADAVRPFQLLLDAVDDGVTLSKAGWLPPTVVKRLATTLGVPSWIGQNNREQHTRPVQDYRRTLTHLGLLKVRKGELSRTQIGMKLSGDPRELFFYIAMKLPLGRDDFDRHAGWLCLLHRAAGIPDSTYGDWVADQLMLLGWAPPGESPVSAFEVYEVTRDTACALGRDAWELSIVSQEGSLALAQAALLRPDVLRYSI